MLDDSEEFAEDIVTEETPLDNTQKATYRNQSSPQHTSTQPARTTVVGLSAEELESFNELIRFDHMYSRPLPVSLANVPSTLFAVDSEEKEEHVAECDQSQLAVDDEETSVLPEFSDADLKQLTDCLDQLLEAEFLNSCANVDDIEPPCLTADCDDEIGFSTDSVVSSDLSTFEILDDSSASPVIQSSVSASPVSHVQAGDSTDVPQQWIHGLENRYVFEQVTTDLAGGPVDHSTGKSVEADDSWVESLLCGYVASPSNASSSGCESDLSSSLGDEQLPYADDNGLFDSYDCQFNDLFPELF